MVNGAEAVIDETSNIVNVAVEDIVTAVEVLVPVSDKRSLLNIKVMLASKGSRFIHVALTKANQ
jgi:hypothetical protein